MAKLSHQARVFIVGTILFGLVLTLLEFAALARQNDQAVLIIVVSGLAALVQVLKVEGATARSSYNIAFVAYGFAFVLLGVPAALFVMFVGSLVEWMWHRYPWYIQTFNIAQLIISGAIAGYAYFLMTGGAPPMSLGGAVAILAATALFVLINHLMVGLVIRFARGQNMIESGVFDRMTLIIDATLFAMGAGGALIWMLNPYATLLAIIPIYLIYSTLRVPALERQAVTDPKTGLFNAHYFNEALEKELARADRFARPLTVVMADLDLLRNINNTYGHLAGDAVLIGVAKILSKSMRDYDIVARFGGEEFAVMLPETAPEQAAARVEMLRSAVEGAFFDISTSVAPIQVTMSFGISGRQKTGEVPNDLVHRADLALYQAKLTGRNRTVLQFDSYSPGGVHAPEPSPNTRAAEELALPKVSKGTGTLSPEPGARAAAPARPLLGVRAGSGDGSSLDLRILGRDRGPVGGPVSAAEAPLEPDAPHPPYERVPPMPPEIPAQRMRTQPALRAPRPAWMATAAIAAVLAVGFGLFAVLALRPSVYDPVGLLIFIVIAVLTEALALEIYVRDTSVSTSAAGFVAGVLLFGPVGALALSLALAATAFIKHRSAPSRFLFNFGNQLLAGGLVVVLIRSSGQPFTALPFVARSALALIAAAIVYLSTTWLVAVMLSLTSGQPAVAAWTERFSWLAGVYLALGLAAFALIFGYDSAGLLGVLTVLVPLLILRYSQGQYIRRTTQNVGQLRATNAELNQRAQEISSLNEELLLALAAMIDLRDPYVLGHSKHVVRYTMLIGQQMGLSPARLELLRKAALLHDLGKVGIPERILFKPAGLDPQEYRVIQLHVTLGSDILATCHSLRPLMAFIRHHHERYDGSGYPDHMRGDEIPLEARILSLADAIEAMASDRPYRVGSSLEAIVAEVRRHTGSQFDPRVVEAFMAVVAKRGSDVIINSARTLDGAAADPSPAVPHPEYVLRPEPAVAHPPPAAPLAGQ